MIFKFTIEEKEEAIECINVRTELFSKLLVAYDFSRHSHKALEYAEYVAERTGGKIYLLHVMEEDEEPEGSLSDVIENVRNRGLLVESIVRKGSPAKIILRVADEIGATTIFMGSRGLGTLKSILLGSTSDTVVRRSDVPVFVCKTEEVNR
jgi:nucleotide-binding universal stress UspA family protein